MARKRHRRRPHGGGQANPGVDQAQGSGGSGRDVANPIGSEAGNSNGNHYDNHCNGNHYDDHSRVDLGRVGPPVAEKAAALLWEEFEALGIDVRRAEPVFPPRPGYGAAGTPCFVRANRFLGRIVDEGLHQYDVTISPEPTPKGTYREVITKLVAENQNTELGSRFPVYDGRDSLFTAGALPFDTKEFEVTLSAGGDKRVDRKYKVGIKHATTISLLQLSMLLAGYPTNIPAEALLVLDTVLCGIAFNERNDMECIAIGRNDRTLAIDEWKGLYHSIRSTQNGLSLISDVSSSVFVQPLLLIDFVQKILKIDVVDRNLTKPEYDKLLKALRGVKIEVTHRSNKRRKYRIAGLTVKPTNDLSFETPSGATKTVIDYFREIYSLELKYKSLPCIDVGSERKPVYLPIEVCKIVPRKCYQKKLEDSQASTLMMSHYIPPELEKSRLLAVEHKQYKGTKRANEFGIEFDDNVTTVDARVLLPPNLKYHHAGSQKTWFPMNGYWTMKDKKVINGAKVSNWACVNFCEYLSNKAIKEFCFKLAEMSRLIGVDFANLKLPIFSARPDQVEDDIRRCYQEAQNKLTDQNIDLLLVILPDENNSLYGKIKRTCETDIGVVSQCCQRSNISTKNNHILANISIKINAKAGGRNSVFNDVQKSLPVVSDKPTIIFGAHVSHPSVRYDSTTPSIASVVASQDWHEVYKYNSVIRAQDRCKEIISDLEDIVKELLHAFENGPNKKPQQLIFYRNGISDGQLKHVLEKEIPAIEKAWKAVYDNEKPQITFIATQKSHSLRLFPMDNKYKHRSAKKKIVEPGTVVDSEICHPAEFDFFLCSHTVTKGPSRPVRYLVLRDDNNFSGDDLQALTNNLCYTYASGTHSVAIAGPAYYAQKLAQRAFVYLAQGSDTATAPSSGSAAAPGGGPRQLPEIKDEMKRSMFYC